MPPLHVSDCGWARYEGFVTGGGPPKQGTYEELEDEMRKWDQNLSVFGDWDIQDSTVSTFHKESQKNKEGGDVDILIYTVPVCVCVCVCVSACDSL